MFPSLMIEIEIDRFGQGRNFGPDYIRTHTHKQFDAATDLQPHVVLHHWPPIYRPRLLVMIGDTVVVLYFLWQSANLRRLSKDNSFVVHK